MVGQNSLRGGNIALNLPFYSSPDDTHCFQAVLKMILAYFLPGRSYTWADLETISAKKERLWTWPTAAVIALREMGFDVVLIEDFDYERFAERGEDYVLEHYGGEVGRVQIDHSDVAQEMRLARELIGIIMPKVAVPSFGDIKRLMSLGYVLACNLNSRILNNKDGYAGHFVVITGIDDDHITLHDPGIPPHPNRKVSKELFEKSWGYPLRNSRNVIAFRLPASHKPGK